MSVHRLHLLTSDEDPGTLDAPRGTAPWARAMRVELRQMWKQGTTQLQRFRHYLQLMEQERGYQHLDDAFGHPFPSLRAFCTADPPFGLGYDAEVLDAIQAETRQMLLGEKVAEIQALQKHGTNQYTESGVDNVNSYSKKGGNASSYRIARLKRDYPEVAEGLARGEYRSVYAAAKAAGLVREKTPLETLYTTWPKAVLLTVCAS